MATYKYCDHMDHEEGAGGQFTPAVAVVEVWMHDTDHTNTLRTTSTKDTCDDHLGEFVENAFSHNRKDKRFEYVKVEALKATP